MSFEAPDSARLPARRPGGDRRATRGSSGTAPTGPRPGRRRLSPRTSCPVMPGWRRHVPVAVLLAGRHVAARRLRAAEGDDHREAPRGDRRARPRRLGVDGLEGRRADAGSARRAAAAEHLIATVPKTLPDRGDHVLRPRGAGRAADARPDGRPRPRSSAPKRAAGNGADRGRLAAVTVADRRCPGSAPHVSPPAVVLVFSDGGADRARADARSRSGRQAAKAHVPVSAVAVGTANGVVDQKITGGYTEQIAVPGRVDDAAARSPRPAHGRVVTTVRSRTSCDNVVAGLEHAAWAIERKGGRGDVGRGGRRDGVDAGGGVPRRRLVPESAVKAFLLAALFVAVAVVAVWPAAGGATNECKGILDCIACPGRGCCRARVSESEYLLSCPKGKGIVAGLDSQATSINVRVSFDGQLGAPVSPGVTTDAERALPCTHAGQAPARRSSRCSAASAAAGGGGRSTVSRARGGAQADPAGPAARSARADGRACGRGSCGRRRCGAPSASGSPGRGTRSRSGRRILPISRRRRTSRCTGRRREGQGDRDGARHRRAVA